MSMRTSLLMSGAIFVVTAVAFSPALRHVLDRDQAELSLAHAGEHEWPATRNLVVRDATVDETRALRSQGDVLAPLVTETQLGGPVKLVAKYRRREEARAPFHGVIRDLWWEGLSDEERAAFARIGVVLASDAKVLELGEPIDLFFYAFVMGFVTLLMGGFLLFDWRRHRRSGRP